MDIVNVTQGPDACTLPTVDRPLRVAEFDRLWASAGPVERLSAQTARVTLPPRPEVAAAAADLAVRETECCSFFTFSLTATGGALHLDVTVPANQTPVLDALVASAERTRTA
jgi:hypothetical protein